MKRIVSIFIGICLCGLLATTLLALKTPAVDLPFMSPVVDFALTDTANSTVRLENLKGHIWIADFFFTTCSGPCPIMTNNLAKLYRSYRLEDKIKLVSITVNPENDTPDVLAEYAKRWDADPDHWIFLTGDRDEISRLAYEGFHLGTKDEPVFHSVSMALVDETGTIRGYYDGTDDEAVQKLFFDTAKLLKKYKAE